MQLSRRKNNPLYEQSDIYAQVNSEVSCDTPLGDFQVSFLIIKPNEITLGFEIAAAKKIVLPEGEIISVRQNGRSLNHKTRKGMWSVTDAHGKVTTGLQLKQLGNSSVLVTNHHMSSKIVDPSKISFIPGSQSVFSSPDSGTVEVKMSLRDVLKVELEQVIIEEKNECLLSQNIKIDNSSNMSFLGCRDAKIIFPYGEDNPLGDKNFELSLKDGVDDISAGSVDSFLLAESPLGKMKSYVMLSTLQHDKSELIGECILPTPLYPGMVVHVNSERDIVAKYRVSSYKEVGAKFLLKLGEVDYIKVTQSVCTDSAFSFTAENLTQEPTDIILEENADIADTFLEEQRVDILTLKPGLNHIRGIYK